MAGQQRMPLWAAEQEIDEDMHDVDLNLAIGNYGQNVYDQGPSIRGSVLRVFLKPSCSCRSCTTHD